jgi:hypothetical protein
MTDKKPGFARQLIQREVVQSVVLYAAIGFAVLEGLSFLIDTLGIPFALSINRFISILYVLGFPAYLRNLLGSLSGIKVVGQRIENKQQKLLGNRNYRPLLPDGFSAPVTLER